jgi:hypothetical protein
LKAAQAKAAQDAKTAAGKNVPNTAQIEAANKQNKLDTFKQANDKANADKLKAEAAIKTQEENIKFKTRLLKTAQDEEKVALSATGMKGGFLNNLSKLWF